MDTKTNTQIKHEVIDFDKEFLLNNIKVKLIKIGTEFSFSVKEDETWITPKKNSCFNKSWKTIRGAKSNLIKEVEEL